MLKEKVNAQTDARTDTPIANLPVELKIILEVPRHIYFVYMLTLSIM